MQTKESQDLVCTDCLMATLPLTYTQSKDFDSCKIGALSFLGRGSHVAPEPSPAQAYQCCGDLCCADCCWCGKASFPGVYLGALAALLVASTTIASAKLSSLGWTTWMNFLGVPCAYARSLFGH